jgi:hypothetical protein
MQLPGEVGTARFCDVQNFESEENHTIACQSDRSQIKVCGTPRPMERDLI